MRPPVQDERKRLKIRNFRMSDEDWEKVEAYFQEQGIPTATGIRAVLLKQIKKKREIL
jgi:hypothetical protein